MNGKSNRCLICEGLGQPKEIVDREAKKLKSERQRNPNKRHPKQYLYVF